VLLEQVLDESFERPPLRFLRLHGGHRGHRRPVANRVKVDSEAACGDRDERSADDAAGHEQHAGGDEYHARETAHQVAVRHDLLY
jgi:hypothetical protein